MASGCSQFVVPANRAAVEHLRAAGYECRHVHQRMRAALDAVPAPLAAPVRRFDLEAEGPAVHELIATAFAVAGTNAPATEL